METKQTTCSCSGTATLVMACGGAADVGELSDRTARVLSRKGAAKMYCLSGIGAGIEGMILGAESAPKILAIDGCPVDCARKCLEKSGFSGFLHLRLTDHGFIKGQSPATEENIQQAESKAQNLLGVELQ